MTEQGCFKDLFIDKRWALEIICILREGNKLTKIIYNEEEVISLYIIF